MRSYEESVAFNDRSLANCCRLSWSPRPILGPGPTDGYLGEEDAETSWSSRVVGHSLDEARASSIMHHRRDPNLQRMYNGQGKYQSQECSVCQSQVPKRKTVSGSRTQRNDKGSPNRTSPPNNATEARGSCIVLEFPPRPRATGSQLERFRE